MASRKPRLLFVGAFPPKGSRIFGGVLTSCRILMQSSFAEKLDLIVVDSTQISNPPPVFAIRFLLAIRRFVTFIIKFEIGRPDAVLLFSGIGASLVEKGAMGWYARLRGRPAFLFPRGGELLRRYEASGTVPGWVKFAFASAKKVFCQGPAWQRFAVAGMKFSIANAPVIQNWTATQKMLDIGKQKDYRSGSQNLQLLFVGWLEESKGILELLEAVRELAKDHSFRVDIIGDGHAFERANRFVNENGLNHIVEFSGWQSGEALEEKFGRADVFVLPSWAEGLPNAMIEAMAAGVCVVTTPVGTIPDVVTDGINGVLVHPKNVEALAKGIRSVLVNDELRVRLSQNGYETALQKFSVEPAANALLTAIFGEG
jgi:glycosyltransferase involved in cell wall biosynthesis